MHDRRTNHGALAPRRGAAPRLVRPSVAAPAHPPVREQLPADRRPASAGRGGDSATHVMECLHVSKQKQVFTTGQVAKICQVAPRTVSKWFDSGKLRGYRIPGSQDRRIPRENLIRFLKENDMPLGALEEEGWHKILIIGAEALFIDRVKELLPEDDDFRYVVANSGFEAGIQAEGFHPDTIIIDLAMGR